MSTPQLFLSSGDLVADRRYEIARDLEARGDLAAAVDVLMQTVERAPDFASAWFALAVLREKTGNRDDAIQAFRAARDADPDDRLGAALHLARLGTTDASVAMASAYVRALFDQYAPRFDQSLARLDYRGPALLLAAVEAACRAEQRKMRFGSLLDLGCGTGLAGVAFRPFVDWLVGVDLSEAMVAEARGKGAYDRLHVADVTDFLAGEAEGRAQFHLITAADVLPYLADITPLAKAAARVLSPGGLFAFTAETHAGDNAMLGDKLRYAHGAAHIRAGIADAGLTLLSLDECSTRSEAGAPVPGLVTVATNTFPEGGHAPSSR
jgi:predicted TPR repeat methyltransferase